MTEEENKALRKEITYLKKKIKYTKRYIELQTESIINFQNGIVNKEFEREWRHVKRIMDKHDWSPVGYYFNVSKDEARLEEIKKILKENK